VDEAAVGSNDPTAARRAAPASIAVSTRYAGLIEEVSKNPGLTPEQKAVAGLRVRQSAEAAAVSRAIMQEAKSTARARRNMQKGES
jgi:hypothetical protein